MSVVSPQGPGPVHEDLVPEASALPADVPGARFRTTRMDPAGNAALTALAQAGAAAFGRGAELTLDRRTAQLLRLRVAQVNNCPYCLDVHHRAAREAGVPDAQIRFLGAWWETRLFSEAERAALEYAEALTRAADTTSRQAFQQVHAALADHFDETEMLEIVGVVLNMNLWTRLKLAQGAMPEPAEGLHATPATASPFR